MRSLVGRLTRETTKSGSGRTELTEKWVKEKFGFLGPHIARLTTRVGIDLAGKLKSRHGTDLTNDSGDEERGGVSDDSQEHDDQGPTEEIDVDDSLPKVKTTCNKKKTRKSADLTNELEMAIRQSTELNEQVRSKLTGPQDSRSIERQNWGQWMTSVLPGIDDRLWTRFKRESMDLIERFQGDTNELQKRDTQRQDFPGQHISPVTEKPSYACGSSAGYLPAWQHTYQLPGQELSFQQMVHEQTRSISAPPTTSTHVTALPQSVTNLLPADFRADSPVSSHSFCSL